MLVLAGHCAAVQTSLLLRKERQEDELFKVILSLANRRHCARYVTYVIHIARLSSHFTQKDRTSRLRSCSRKFST